MAGNRSRLASRSFDPKARTKVPRPASKPCAQTSAWEPARNSRHSLIGYSRPFLDGSRQLEHLRAAHRAVESKPRHCLGVREMLAATANFPQALVGLSPDPGKVQQKFTLHGPTLFVGAKTALPCLVQRV